MKKYLLILLLLPLMGLGDELRLAPPTGTGLTNDSARGVTDINQDLSKVTFVTNQIANGGASDGFLSEVFDVGDYGGVVATVCIDRITVDGGSNPVIDEKDTSFATDTLRVRAITGMKLWKRYASWYDTLAFDTLIDTGAIQFWLGKCNSFVGSDSLMSELWFDFELIDSTGDSTGSAELDDCNHNYYLKIEVEKKQ